MKLNKSELQLESLVARIADGEIDLQPDFQRGEIWDTRRRQRLIDTILREWYVPAIHLVRQSDSNELVLDGQQRLAAIRDFFDDKFTVDGRIEPDSEFITELHGKRFSQLPDGVRRALKRFSIQLISLTDFAPQEPNELFFRLNQAYNLTPPEKRNALHGLARDQVKEIVELLTESGLLDRQTIGFSNGRLAYDDVIARVCVAIEIGTLRRHINNGVVEDFYRNSEFAEDTVIGVRNSGAELMVQILNSDARIKFNKGSLQTWLIYCYWAPRVTGPIPRDLLTRFETDRLRLRGGSTDDVSLSEGRLLQSVVGVYDDRAAYRVTDVSSVLARDVALHLYSVARFGTAPRRGSDVAVSAILDNNSTNPRTIFSHFVDDSAWGDTLLDD